MLPVGAIILISAAQGSKRNGDHHSPDRGQAFDSAIRPRQPLCCVRRFSFRSFVHGRRKETLPKGNLPRRRRDRRRCAELYLRTRRRLCALSASAVNKSEGLTNPFGDGPFVESPQKLHAHPVTSCVLPSPKDHDLLRLHSPLFIAASLRGDCIFPSVCAIMPSPCHHGCPVQPRKRAFRLY
jgi:hypothetical protein